MAAGETGRNELRAAQEVAAQALAASDQQGRRSLVLDLGCGAGEQAVWLAQQGLDVLALDYSPNALALTRARARAADVSLTARHANFYELRSLADLLEAVRDHDGPVHLHAHHLLERLGDRGRAHLLRLLRQVARRGGTIVATVDTLPAPDVSFADPSTWHLEVSTLKEELSRLGLGLTHQRLLDRTDRDRERRTLQTRIALLVEDSTTERTKR